MEAIRGTWSIGGIALGPIRICPRMGRTDTAGPTLSPEEELNRFEAARRGAIDQLEDLYGRALDQTGMEAAAIFRIHQMLLEDPDYQEAVHTSIRRGEGACRAVQRAGARFTALFSAMEDEYMQARADDMRDITRRVADLLTGVREEDLLGGEPSILAAEELSPSQLIGLDRDKLLGLVTRDVGASSHTAILARAMGVPAVMGVEIQEDWQGRTAMLDGDRGWLYLDPTEQIVEEGEQMARKGREERLRLNQWRDRDTVTLDGREMPLLANIGSGAEGELARQKGAQGVGLFRSEFLFLDRDTCPDEEEQFAAYSQVVRAMAGRPVVIRTLDVGGDKQAPCLGLEGDSSPLGCRGIRLSLARPDLFRPQLRAILRSGALGPVSLMLPMVTAPWEVRRAREILEECRSELQSQGREPGEVRVGIMVETPAAVVLADELALEADFFSLGTNDLTQYTLAADRCRAGGAYDPRHPAVLRMIRHTVEAGHRHGLRVSICGDLGADPDLTETFLRMGVDSLSISPEFILPLRELISGLDLSEDRPAE